MGRFVIWQHAGEKVCSPNKPFVVCNNFLLFYTFGRLQSFMHYEKFYTQLFIFEKQEQWLQTYDVSYITHFLF